MEIEACCLKKKFIETNYEVEIPDRQSQSTQNTFDSNKKGSNQYEQNLLADEEKEQEEFKKTQININNQNLQSESSQSNNNQNQIENNQSNNQQNHCCAHCTQGILIVFILYYLYCFGLMSSAITVQSHPKLDHVCDIASQWTIALSIILILSPILTYFGLQFDKRVNQYTYYNQVLVNMSTQFMGKFVFFIYFVVGVILTIFCFKYQDASTCQVMLNLVELFLFLFWMIIYVCIKALTSYNSSTADIQQIIPDPHSIHDNL